MNVVKTIIALVIIIFIALIILIYTMPRPPTPEYQLTIYGRGGDWIVVQALDSDGNYLQQGSVFSTKNANPKTVIVLREGYYRITWNVNIYRDVQLFNNQSIRFV